MSANVRKTVWNWQQKNTKLPAAAMRARMRRRAVLQAAIMFVVGTAVYFKLGHQTSGLVINTVAIGIFFLGLSRPDAYKPIHQFGLKLGRVVGQLLAYLLLTPLYFLVFMPGAWWLRWRGRDPMHRQMRDKKYTCWIARHAEPTVQSYERQFMIEDKAARGALRPVGVTLPDDKQVSS